MTNQELLNKFREGEQVQKALWQEILARGLYLEILGIDPRKRDSAWRNPPGTDSRLFFAGVHRVPRSAVNKPVSLPSVSVDLSDMPD